MTPYYKDSAVTLYLSDCINAMASLPDGSADALVSDPPYGIGFMGREWDTFKPGYRKDRWDYSKDPKGSDALHAADYDRSLTGMRGFQTWTEQWAREAVRVLKPGGYAVVCGAPRAYHRMASGLEDAGFEIRDCLAWLFGSGFPKSLNLGGGLGTALKPAHEPIVLARKPFKGTVAGNVEKHGTGALNIDACRIEGEIEDWPEQHSYSRFDPGSPIKARTPVGEAPSGRWPANVVIDDIAALVIDAQSGELQSGDGHVLRRGATTGKGMGYGSSAAGNATGVLYGDSGGASRFYYVAKPSREERDYGCHAEPTRSAGACTDRADGSAGLKSPRAGAGRTGGHKNFHPTVKPVELMRWLVRLVTPPGGVVLDPFLGSGTTGMACRYEQRPFIGIERELDYMQIAERRIRAVSPLFAEVELGTLRDAVDPVDRSSTGRPRATDLFSESV